MSHNDFTNDFSCERSFSTAKQDADKHASAAKNSPQMQSPAYKLAYHDYDFMIRDELRPVRLQLELLKAELALQEHNIDATVVIFGSARLLNRETAQSNLDCLTKKSQEYPNDLLLQDKIKKAKRDIEKSHYYEQARELGARITKNTSLVVVTGGGGGVMQAANQGAFENGGKSIGFNIALPHEQTPNSYITPDLCFQFHYFAIRKMHLLMRAKALVAFPGGFGTLDELFEALTLVQTRKMRRIPIILFGKSYWNRVINFDALVEEGAISNDDLLLINYAETVDEAWNLIIQSTQS